MSNASDFIIKNGVLTKYIGPGGDVIIPEGVTEIGFKAFAGSKTIKSVTISDSVFEIMISAFCECTKLEKVIIPGNVTFIGCGALDIFGNTTIYAPAGSYAETYAKENNIPFVAELTGGNDRESSGANNGILEGKTIVVTGDLMQFPEPGPYPQRAEFRKFVESHGGKLTSAVSGKTSYLVCNDQSSGTTKVRQAQEKGIPILTEIEFLTLLGDVRSAAILKNNDFEIKNNVLIKYTGRGGDVEIPAGVTKIGRDAFAECKNLISVKLPASVAEIGIYAFSGCSSLRSIEIPEGVTEIRGYTFMGCENLQEVKLPESLVKIGHKAFCWCSALSRIRIPKNVYWIGSWAFEDCYSLEEIVLPELVTRVCGQTFVGCSGLKRVTMSGNVTQIDDIAFKFCNRLISLTGTENVTEIGFEAFSDCVRLISLPLPKIPLSVLEKKKAATKSQACLGFLQTAKHCTDPVVFAEYKKYAIHQRTVHLPWILHNDVVDALAFYAENGRVTAANFEKEYLIPAQKAKAVNCIAYLMKWSSENIKPEDWEKEEQKEIRKALRPERKKSPYNVADMQKLWYYRAEKDGTITIQRYIGTETDVIVPAKIGRKPVAKIGGYAFSRKKNLKSVTIPKSVTEIGAFAFGDAEALETIVLPDSIRKIGPCAFMNCSSLTEIVIPEGVTEIERETFAQCKNLKTVVLSENVRHIYSHAFYASDNLTIKGAANSYVERYAKNNAVPFVAE